MKVMDAQGGRWNKKEKCHLFPSDPRATFQEALQNGVIVHAKKTRQAFYTPPNVVATMMTHASPRDGQTVLEPSAGDGAIADAARQYGARVTCVENDPASVLVLMGNGHEVLGVDFLALTHDGFNFDMVVMNPPFTKGQDAAHITHALKFVKPGGFVFAIIGETYVHHTAKKYSAFRDLLAARGTVLEKFTNHEFRESGTDVNTRLIRLSM